MFDLRRLATWLNVSFLGVVIAVLGKAEHSITCGLWSEPFHSSGEFRQAGSTIVWEQRLFQMCSVIIM